MDGAMTINAKLTRYYPYKNYVSAAEAQQEGGPHDSNSRPLITLQQHLSDPQAYPYVAVSGDDAIWPYGQRISIDAYPEAVFRVVDTGSHFRRLRKVYRLVGFEPLDIASDYPGVALPTTAVVTIMAGDNWSDQKHTSVSEVNSDLFQGQSVT